MRGFPDITSKIDPELDDVNMLRRFCTPLGVATMVLALWLPWTRIECREIKAAPDVWQLAAVDAWLYVPIVLALSLAVLALLCIWKPRGLVCWPAALAAIAACATCLFMLGRRQELVRQQIELQAAGGDVAAWLKDLQVEIGPGFWLYFAGAVVTLALVLWEGYVSVVRRRTRDTLSSTSRPG